MPDFKFPTPKTDTLTKVKYDASDCEKTNAAKCDCRDHGVAGVSRIAAQPEPRETPDNSVEFVHSGVIPPSDYRPLGLDVPPAGFIVANESDLRKAEASYSRQSVSQFGSPILMGGPKPKYNPCGAYKADTVGSNTCLYPDPRYPRDCYVKYMNDGSCELAKFLVSYTRSYRMTYWGYQSLKAIRALPIDVRSDFWDRPYHEFLPDDSNDLNEVVYSHGSWITLKQYLAPGLEWFSLRDWFGGYNENRAWFIESALYWHLARFQYGWPYTFGWRRYKFILQGQVAWICDDRGDEGHNNGAGTVWLCSDSFYGYSTSYVAWIIGHEMLHHLGSLDDQIIDGKKAYGPTRARVLAEFDKDKAIKNIDNYGLWMYGMFYAWNKMCNLFKPLKVGKKTYSFNMKTLKWES